MTESRRVETQNIEIEGDVSDLSGPVIVQLMNSIKDKGLLHEPTGYWKDGRAVIFAGKKRAIAAQRIGLQAIFVKMYETEPTETERKEVQMHENLFRDNLQWYEQIELEKQLHELRQLQHGVGKQRVKSGWSLRDTAKELELSIGTLSQDLRLAEAVAQNPDLKRIKDKTTALRLMNQAIKREEAEIEAKFLFVDKERTDVALCGESDELLKYYPDKFFNACITDPPWLEYKDKNLTKDDKTFKVFEQVFRVLKNDSFLYAFVSTPDFIWYQQELPKLGFKVQQTPLIWVKENVITPGLRSWEYARDFELIILAVKGSPVLTAQGQNSAVFIAPVLPAVKLIHPHEKPIGIIKKIIDHCSYENSVILDPFGGSGVVAQAAKEMGRHYVTIEREKRFFDNIAARLGQDQSIMELPTPPEDAE